MKQLTSLLIVFTSVFILSGCIPKHNLQLTMKNSLLTIEYQAEDVLKKIEKCYNSDNREILFEQPVNANFKKIRIYTHSNNYHRLSAVLTIFGTNKKAIYINEDLSENLKLADWIKNNMECKL